ncbi:MAG: response regulator transcription factor [Planctomycetota bacterium]
MEYKSILVIDDDIDFLEWLKIGLTSQGYKVFTATTGKDGLNILKNNEINLIVLDILLPDIDGFELIKKLKMDEKPNKKIPILAVTGVYKEAEYKQKGFSLGVDDFITKPFSYKFLAAKVKKLLETQI